MPKVLRSKPVLLVGAATLLKKVRDQAAQRRRKARGRKIAGILGATGLVGLVKYFTNPLDGQRRRAKIKNIVTRSDDFEQDWQPLGNGNSEIKIPEITPSPKS